MKLLVRIALSLLLAVVLLFCTFGFLATFEPLPAATQWTWRSIYATVAILSTLGATTLWKKLK